MSKTGEAAVRDDLQALLDGFIARGIVGASLAVTGASEAPMLLAAGLADRAARVPLTLDRLFKIGSCTKTFVAATLMSVVREYGVALTAPVAAWFPDLPFADRIRVRQLVAHTAGLPEFEFIMPMEPGHIWTPKEIVALAYTAGPPGKPDVACAYNNTGYVLAGMLIERLTGSSLAAEIRKRVLAPLGLGDSYAAAGEAFPAERLVRGYYHRPVPPPGLEGRPVAEGGEMWRTGGTLTYSDELQDASAVFPMTGAYGAGDMISTSADLARFLGALVGGKLLPPDITADMVDKRRPGTSATPGTRLREAGAGIWLMRYAGHDLFGHQGSMPGYVTVMVHHRPSGITLALTTNTGSGNRLSFYASGLHGLVDAILGRVLGWRG
ncbi:MAG TPA: serine hydrolase domain-containing protein [Gemmatimonadales bacterium]|nr:serine hydrolase domain-containing protein [Gemmatimonadales bacterium]